MRAAKTVIMIWIFFELTLWIRDGHGFCVLDALPFVARDGAVSRDYDWFALAALLIYLWGYLMLASKPRGQQQPTGTGFRMSILLVPATLVGLALLSQRLTCSRSFAEVVGNSEKLPDHRYLATLCAVLFAALLMIKRFRNP